MNKRGLVGLTVLLFLGVFFLFHPFFRIQSVSYQGYYFVPKHILKHYLDPLKGKHILASLMTWPLKKNMLAQLPSMKNISIRPTSLSSIRVSVEEKMPWVVFITPSDQYFVAQDGSILNHFNHSATAPDFKKLLLVHARSEDFFKESYIPASLRSNIALIVDYISLYFSIENLQLEYHGEDSIVLIKDDTWPIKLGSLDYLDVKMRHLNLFLNALSEDVGAMAYIDLRLEDRVIVKYYDK